MADIMTPVQRSERMSRIRSQDTKPEMLVRRFLHGKGLRFRLHARDLPGSPDLVLPKYRAVVFVEGCFWHGHSCQKGRVPGTNPDFWQAKVAANQARDKRNQRALRRDGWQVIRVWECQLSKSKTRDATLARLVSRILA
jgi:DNA mismatch endonuclease (patch repair protein)